MKVGYEVQAMDTNKVDFLKFYLHKFLIFMEMVNQDVKIKRKEKQHNRGH